MGGEALTATLDALLARPNERTDKAKAVLSLQPLMANHPIVAGTTPTYVPHRPERIVHRRVGLNRRPQIAKPRPVRQRVGRDADHLAGV